MTSSLVAIDSVWMSMTSATESMTVETTAMNRAVVSVLLSMFIACWKEVPDHIFFASTKEAFLQTRSQKSLILSLAKTVLFLPNSEYWCCSRWQHSSLFYRHIPRRHFLHCLLCEVCKKTSFCPCQCLHHCHHWTFCHRGHCLKHLVISGCSSPG